MGKNNPSGNYNNNEIQLPSVIISDDRLENSTTSTLGSSKLALSPFASSATVNLNNNENNNLSYLKKVENQENNQESSFGDDMLRIEKMIGYSKSIYGEILYFSSIIFTVGTIFIFFHWFELLYIKFRFKVQPINHSNFVLVHSEDSRIQFCKVNSLDNGEKYIIFRFTRFFLNNSFNVFEKSKLNNGYEKVELLKLIKSGLNNEQSKREYEKFGKNEINIPLKSIPVLLLEEVLHPFFVFQLYSVSLWIAEEYYWYAIAIFLIATISAILNLKEVRSNLISLQKISHFLCDVSVLRNGQFQIVQSNELVPGDIIELKQDAIMPCDVALLSGQAILNESMLTGESIPVTKYSVLSDDEIKQFNNNYNNQYSTTTDLKDLSKEKRSLIFGGTIVVKLISSSSDDRVLGMVRDTSFQTTKGKLILSILYPKNSHFKFFSESLKFIGVLSSLALIGFALSVWRLKSLGMDAKTIVIRALDLITIVVPPALPMAMSVGTGFGLSRLKKKKVYCISPQRLNMAGKIQVFCFDKTGTITEEGLDLLGIITTNGTTFNQLSYYNATDNNDGGLFKECKDNIFKYLMSSCHSLTMINGQLSGDPLEVKVFESTRAKIIDNQGSSSSSSGQSIILNDNSSTQIDYLENFDFQSALQRMSVIIQVKSSKETFSLVKGSPEMIKGLCLNQSLPRDYDEQLAIYTEKGYRVLACAFRNWDSNQIFSKRELLRKESESNLIFLGFIIMENKMKPESSGIIKTLQDANIRTVMVTGDNPLTATSVAKQCGIIQKHTLLFMGILSKNESNEDEISWEQVISKEDNTSKSNHTLDPDTLYLNGSTNGLLPPCDYNFIITGPVFKHIFNDYIANGSLRFITMLRRGLVYSRMTPDQKQSLIEELQRLGLYVGMCGDGANDCGALKAAHVGISLSESEASIAAPFTSTITNISCCPELIKEGRASLVVSFKLFQYIGMYSLIQFVCVIFLYFNASVLGNYMYLYQDLWVVFPLVIFMGMTKPCDKLSAKRPSGRLISGDIIGSMMVHIIVCVAFQIAIYFLVQHQSWYTNNQIDEDNIQTYITTSLFIYATFQDLIMLLTFSFGKPFLKPMYSNILLFITYFITFSTTLLLLFVPTKKVWEFGELLIVPVSWRFIMFAFLVGNLLLNLLVEFSFFMYKRRSKKKKSVNITVVYPKKDTPKDSRIISQHSVSFSIRDTIRNLTRK